MFVSKNDLSSLEGRYVFVDNDFLSFLFRNDKNLEESLSFLPKSYLTVDPFVEFEFLRDLYMPEEIDFKQKFISTKEVFTKIDSHHEIFDKVKTNALILSKMYSQQKGKDNKGGWSTIDLLLAGRVMLHGENAALITGNKKDFPPSIFNTVGILSYETNEGTIKSFAILVFDKAKYKKCEESLSLLEKKKSI